MKKIMKLEKPGKKSVEYLTHTYMRRLKKSMICPACQHGKFFKAKGSSVWYCEECGYEVPASEFEDNYMFWFCDECNAYLNNQVGFNRLAPKHSCCSCGYENDISCDKAKGICLDCGRILPNSDDAFCDKCWEAWCRRAKEVAQKVGKIGIAVVVSVGAFLALQSTDDKKQNNFGLFDWDGEGDFSMKCANCGNVTENSLWDEGDTIYCSKCGHRTSKETGEDDLVECPYCHRMRDRKALYCRWCNDSSRQASTRAEKEEIDKILTEMGC